MKVIKENAKNVKIIPMHIILLIKVYGIVRNVLLDMNVMELINLNVVLAIKGEKEYVRSVVMINMRQNQFLEYGFANDVQDKMYVMVNMYTNVLKNI